MEAIQTNCPSLVSETFSHGRTRYFIDMRRAVNDSHYLTITSSEQYRDQAKYYRQTVLLWEEDLPIFVEAFSMVLSSLAYGQLALPEAKMEVVKNEEAKGMKAIADYDRPREKLQALGAGSLRLAAGGVGAEHPQREIATKIKAVNFIMVIINLLFIDFINQRWPNLNATKFAIAMPSDKQQYIK